jgi:cell division protein FtsQ
VTARPAAPPRLLPLRLALAACLLAGGVFGGYALLDLPLRTIDVQGPFQRVTAVQVEAAMRGALAGGFLSADLTAVRDALEALPWVDRAQVRRVWPAGLAVTVTEQVAAARWGESGLLNARGELFLSDARQLPRELPLLAGPPGSEGQVARLYFDFQARLLPLGMRIGAITLDPRGAWRIELASGVELRLGREAQEERMERFVRSAAPIVSARARDLAYVDLRYSNGFALGWRPAAEDGDV